MDDKLYIKKFIRDDGEKLSFDGEQLYLAQENTLLVRPDPSTTAVNFTEADGGEMIRQQNTTYDQPVNGLIIPKSTDYWTLTKQLSLFFKVNHTYKIIYVKKDGSMFKVSNAWISSGLQIVPVPHEEYSSWSITMTIGNVNWTEYAEDSQGDEIYSNTITLPLISAATGGEEWEYEEGEEVSGEGSEIELDTSAGATVDDLEIKGDTFQQTYSGKNLFSVLSASSTNGGIKWTRNVNSITVTGSSSTSLSYRFMDNGVDFPELPSMIPAGTYTLSVGSISGATSNQKLNFQFRDSNKTSIVSGQRIGPEATSITVTLTSDAYYFRVAIEGLAQNTPVDISYKDIMLESGSISTSYEPYVGGIPAPNPDYPQDIEVVTGEQTVWVHGKNLFNPALLTQTSGYNTYNSSTGLWNTNTGSNYFRSIFYNVTGNNTTRDINKLIPLQANKTYTIKFYDFQNNTSQELPLDYALFDNLGVKISNTRAGNFYTFTTPNQECYLDIRREQNSGSVSFSKIMLVEGTYTEQTFPSYEPTQSYTVDLGSIELCKIGDYQDYIYKSGDDWYVHKAVKRIIFDGTESWSLSSSTNFFLTTSVTDVTTVLPSEVAPVCSNYYTAVKRTDVSSALVDYGIAINYDSPRIYIRNKDITTVAIFKTWLGSNNTTVYYALATPTDTKITDNTLIGELEALYSAQGYNEKTIITVSATSPNLPAILAVTLQNPPIKGEVWDNVGTVWELGSGGTQTVNIDSTTTVYPVWKVEGPCVNPTLQNNTTDTIAQYDGTVAAGQTLTVNFEEGTAYLDSALVTRYVTGLVSLKPGENTVGFNSDGGDTETSIISWNNVIN